MSDLHFLEQLGNEFVRLEAQDDGHRSRRPAPRTRAPRGVPAGLGLGLSVLVVIAVAVVSIGVHGRTPSGSPASEQNRIRVTLNASVIDPRVGLGPALTRALPILRTRLAGVPGVVVSRLADGVVVTAPGGQAARARIAAVAFGVPAQLSFYDWEADVVAPAGRSLVSRLGAQDPAALVISQGSGTASPGEAAAGGLSLYAASRIASRQPPVSATSGLARPGRQYYLFGPAGSVACRTAARDQHTSPVPGRPCPLLAGPVTETSTNGDQIARDLAAALLPGISASEGVRIVIPQGTVVVQAARAGTARLASPPSAYFVLRDRVGLAGRSITDPQPGTDQAGHPDVQFGFTDRGADTFARVTAEIAHRGQMISRFHQTLNQHFAVVYGDRLISVPQVDFRTYPDGVPGNQGADLTGGFTPGSAQALAAQLRTGPLPVHLSVR